MDFLLAIANFLVNEILSVPAFLIGIITAVGLAAMGRGTGKTCLLYTSPSPRD